MRYVLRVKVAAKPEEKRMVTNQDESARKNPVHVEKKIGRNDPCPCGSGRKYKKCCGRTAS